MPAADGVDARSRRVAARLLPGLSRRSQLRSGGSADGRQATMGRHVVAGHPARAARIGRTVHALESEGWVGLGPVHRPGHGRRLIEHLVIGPGGIVVIDSQAWVGRIEVTRGVVQQNGFWREPECAEVARTAGSIAALLLPQHRTAVHAVICVAQHDLSPHFVAPGVHVVGASGLARMLRSFPRRLHPAEILQLHTQLRHALSDVHPPEQLTTAELGLAPRFDWPSHPADLDPSVRGATLFVPMNGRSLRRAARVAARRRAPRFRRRLDGRLLAARLLLAVLVAVAAVVFGPGLVQNPLAGRPVQPLPPSMAPADPIPANPIPADPIPADPIPADPIPADPIPAERLPDGPLPDGPLPDGPAQATPAAATANEIRHVPR